MGTNRREVGCTYLLCTPGEQVYLLPVTDFVDVVRDWRRVRHNDPTISPIYEGIGLHGAPFALDLRYVMAIECATVESFHSVHEESRANEKADKAADAF